MKLAAIALLLGLRREEPELFSTGDYQSIVIEGDRSDWAFGYVRASGNRRLAVLSRAIPLTSRQSPRGTPWRACRRVAGSTCSAAAMRPSATLFMSGCIRCRLRCCWPDGEVRALTWATRDPPSQEFAQIEASSGQSRCRPRRRRFGPRPTGHCQTKLNTAYLGAETRSSFTVFARKSLQRSTRFEAENCLYLFALTVPSPTMPPTATIALQARPTL